MKKMTRKSGFTIAELAVAMMMVAGIAMLLLPSLVADNEKQVLATALKKTYSELQQVNQAVGLLVARGQVTRGAASIDTLKSVIPLAMKVAPESAHSAYLNRYSPLASPALISDDGKALANNTEVIILKSGVFLFFDADGNLVVDVNGRKPPNITGKDIYYFVATPDREDDAILLTPLQGGACPDRGANNDCQNPEDCKGCAVRVLEESGRIDWY